MTSDEDGDISSFQYDLIWSSGASIPMNSPKNFNQSIGFKEKPLWRGLSHQYAFFVSIFTGLVIVWYSASHAQGDFLALLSVAVFALSVSLLLGVSALYHRVQWDACAGEFMRKCDHASIYFLICGTYTPIMIKGLHSETSRLVLSIVWGVSLLGIGIEFFAPRAPKWLKAVIYVAIGWVAVAVVSQIYSSMGPWAVALISLGGVFYTVGALVYALKRPQIKPEVFGYHELFHLFVIAGALTHYVLVFMFVV